MERFESGKLRRVVHRDVNAKAVVTATAFAVLFLSLVVVGPAVAQSVYDELVKYGIIVESATIGALIGGAIGGPVGAGVGALIGGALGAWYVFGSQSAGGASIAAQNLQENFSRYLIGNLSAFMRYANDNNYNMLNTYELSQFYHIRRAEYAAWELYQLQWPDVGSYDAQYVLSRSQVAEGSIAHAWCAGVGYTNIFNSYSTVTDYFTGDYQGMSVGMASVLSTGTTVELARAGYGEYFLVRYGQVLNKDGYQSGMLFIPTQQEIAVFGRNGVAFSNVILSFKDEAGNVIKNITVGDIPADGIVLVNLTNYFPSREVIYANIVPNTNVWVYGFASGINAAPHAGFIPIIYDKATGTFTHGYFVYLNADATLDDQVVTVIAGSNSYLSGNIYYRVYYQALLGEGYYQTGIVTDSLRTLDAITQKAVNMMTTANNFALAYYNTLVQTGTDPTTELPPPPPDAFLPPTDLIDNMTWEEVYALYIAWLRALSDWFANHTGQLPYVNFTVEGFSVKIAGMIQRWNGTDWVNLTPAPILFVPFPQMRDFTFVSGWTHVVNQSMFVIELGPWDGVGPNVTTPHLRYWNLLPDPSAITRATGEYDRLVIYAIYVNGTEVNNVTIHIKQVELEPPSSGGAPAAWPSFGDVTGLIMDWIAQHMLTTIFIAGAALTAISNNRNKWVMVVLFGVLAFAAYYYIEPNLGAIGTALGVIGG